MHAVQAQHAQVIGLYAVAPGVHTDGVIRLHGALLFAPVGNGRKHVPFGHAQLLLCDAQPRLIAGTAQTAMPGMGIEVPPPFVGRLLELGQLPYFHEAQAALELTFHDVLGDLDAAGRTGTAGSVILYVDAEGGAEVPDQTGLVAAALVHVEDTRHTVHGVTRPSVAHGINKSCKDSGGIFPGCLFVAHIEGMGAVIHDDVADYALPTDFHEAAGLLYIVEALINEAHLFAAGAGKVEQHTHGAVHFPHMIWMFRPLAACGLAARHLVGVTAQAAHGGADGFRAWHGDFSGFGVFHTVALSLKQAAGSLDGQRALAVGAGCSCYEAAHGQSQFFINGALSRVAACFATCLPARLFEQTVNGLDAFTQSQGGTLHQFAAPFRGAGRQFLSQRVDDLGLCLVHA